MTGKQEDEKEEEKPDMRSKYAMINIIKNKLRAAGQRDPMVMAVDACEGVGAMEPKITTKRKDIPYEPKLIKYEPILIPKKKKGSKMKTEEVVNEDEKKKIETMIKTKKMNGKDLTPEQLQGLDAGLTQGGNPSVLNPPKTKKDTAPKRKKKPTGPTQDRDWETPHEDE